jgi:hypothetical protein
MINSQEALMFSRDMDTFSMNKVRTWANNNSLSFKEDNHENFFNAHTVFLTKEGWNRLEQDRVLDDVPYKDLSVEAQVLSARRLGFC